MKPHILTFSLLIFIIIPCKAQVPGFIGKRIVVSGGIMFCPAHHPTYNNRQESRLISDFTTSFLENYSVYGINWTKALGIDCAISRSSTLGVNFQNMRSSAFIYDQNSKINIRYVYGNSIGANIKFFNIGKGALAPIGNFQKIGLSLLLTRSYDSLDNILKTAPTKNHFYTFTYGFGKTVIIKKSFTFTYGMDITLMLDRNIGPLISRNDSRRYWDASFYRIRKMQFLNVYATVGYIF